MKIFLKNHLLNIIFGFTATILLILAFIGLFDWIINPIFWIIECILIALTFVYKQNNTTHKNSETSNNTKFILFTKFKTILIIISLLLAIYLEIASQQATGLFAGLGEVILLLFDLAILFSILVVNFIFRIHYRIKYDQKFDFKSVYTEHIFIKLIILILIAIVGYLYFQIS